MRRLLRSVMRATACSAMITVGASSTTADDSIQTGDGLLMITANMPEKARVGELFTYNVEVTNSSDNIVLHDIELKQSKAKGFSIESVSMEGKQNEQQNNAENTNQKDQKQQQAAQSEKSGSSQSSSSSSNSKDSMKISVQMPGESRTFVVKASADEEGELRSCLQIASYTPALCLTSQVVKPELELTKTAPNKANRCNVIELTYRVKNGGSGDVGKFTVTDSLGEGLVTIEGNSELSFPVDGLAAGATREFVARVYAQKPGEFSSRAVAKAENSELKSRSKATTTKVIAADLNVTVNGPSRIYGGDLAKFTATITNTGNAAAESVNVNVKWPTQANLADMGEYAKTMTDSSSGDSKNSQQSGNQPTMASKQDSKNQEDSGQEQDSSNEQMGMQSESFVIDRLEAGETAEFTYAIRTDNLQELPTKVQARHVCTVDSAEDQAKSTAKVTAMAMATVKVVRLPALQFSVVDDEDPVKSGSKVRYTINVWNEGDAPDQNVQVIAKLPNNLKFDSANGPTEVKSEGNTIRFEPIKTMQPGDRAEFTVTAKPIGTGNARFEAALTSKMLQNKVISEEPTRLVDSSVN